MVKASSRCLLCLVKVEPTSNFSQSVYPEVEESLFPHYPGGLKGEDEEAAKLTYNDNVTPNIATTSNLQRQLDVIFLLRNLLQIPSSHVIKFLKVRGDPEGWVSWCGSCDDLVRNAKVIFLKIQRLSTEFDEARVKAEERIRIKAPNLVKEIDFKNEFILEECRRIVRKRKRAVVKNVSFLEGDRQARKLLLNYVQQPDQGIDEDRKKEETPREGPSPNDRAESFEVQKEPDAEEIPAVNPPMEINDDYQLSNHDAFEDNPSPAFPGSLSPTSTHPEDKSDDDDDYQCNEEQDSESEFEDSTPLQTSPSSKRSSRSRKRRSLNTESESEGNVEKSRSASKLSSKKSKLPKQSKPKYEECHVCHKSIHRQNLNIHLFTVHNFVKAGKRPPTIYTCSVEGCGKVFTKKYLFEGHLSWHEKRPTCTTCKREFKAQANLDKHDFYVHKIVKPNTKNFQFFECPKCEQRFQNEKWQISHSLICKVGAEGEDTKPEADPDNNFPCPYCGKVVLGEYRLEKHIKSVHPTGKKWEHCCYLCPKTFSASKVLNHHLAKCHDIGTENYLCSKCGKFCDSKVGRKFHVCYKAENKCEICGKVFKQKWELKKHITLVHEKILNVLCDLCDHRAGRMADLRMHQAAKHQIGIKCKVDGCPQHFATQRWMEKHVKKVHENLLNLSCDLCDLKGLTREIELLRHKAVKHKIGIQCGSCTRFFGTKGMLEVHMKKVHPPGTRERRYLCTLCGQGFFQECKLKTHIEAIHLYRGSKPYKCQVCRKGFATTSYLNLHMRVHRRQQVKKEVTSSSDT